MADDLPFRVVLVTAGSPHAGRILEHLHRRGVVLDAVVLVGPMPWQNLLPRGGGATSILKAPFRPLKRLADRSRFRTAHRKYARMVRFTGPLNSDRMQRELERLAPDFILLGGIGILKTNILQTAARGVINSHPGLLPWLRGTGVVAHALHRGYPVGATSHYVTAGIDTGRIIERRLVEIAGDCGGLSELEEKADRLAAEMMADLVVERIAAGEVPEGVAQDAKFPYCKWPKRKRRDAADEAARSGRAAELFEAWAEHSGGAPRYLLPLDFRGPEEA